MATPLDVQVVRYVVNGEAGVSSLTIEARLVICRICDQFSGDNCRLLSTKGKRAFVRALVGVEGAHGDCARGLWPVG